MASHNEKEVKTKLLTLKFIPKKGEGFCCIATGVFRSFV